MQDVAKAAGVSSATVSRVFSGQKGAMSNETAERVRKVADDLGYVVNTLAASLRVQHTKSVGLILADVANPFFGKLASGVENTLSAAGFGVILGNSSNRIEEETRLLRLMMQKQVDAIILASVASNGEHLRDVLGQGQTIILVDSDLPGTPLDAVVIDNRAAAAHAVGHLLDLGHRRIAIVCGPMTASFDRERLEGYRAAFRQRGLEPPEDLVLYGDSTYDGGKAAVEEMLLSEARPTALFASNNLMTIGTLAALHEVGLAIPGDISVVGFDDLEWYAIFKPRITAVAQPAFAIGRTAARRLLDRLKLATTPPPRRFVLNTDLIVRDSTAPLHSTP
ncbi:LacI family DNA-binding transcriptional regulator [Ancylobacter lacus]|uniref:LacI family DNA-binding transcriptional regulator n=1 Tax=Ancylobacter lacus TaxID=2579970 RepID=UPI001BCD6FC7|nr:substrate-binding domain-containing protein [Ancylobacter lacus]MBS7540339.1 substrate-binding domain-containing protein [Ancylobacter lacus]